MDGGAWKTADHGVGKSWKRLSDFTFTFHSHALEKEMATHSSVLAWRIPGMGDPGGLPSMGLHRVDTAEATWQQQQQAIREALVLLLSQVFVCFLKKFINFYLYLLFLSLGVSLCFFPSFIKFEPQVKTFILYDFEHLKFIFNHCFSGTSQICIYWLFLPHLIGRIL